MTQPQRLHANLAPLGPQAHARQFLPQRGPARIGAWCFVDHFGPLAAGEAGLDEGPHPHAGVQTLTWLFEGELFHTDSLGNRQVIRPGELNLLTAGRGLAHTEDVAHAPRGVHGVQLWIALPDTDRWRAAGLVHHPFLPTTRLDDAAVKIVIGSFAGLRSPAEVFTPLSMLEVRLPAGGLVELPLILDFEYLALVTSGEAVLSTLPMAPGEAVAVPAGTAALPFRAVDDTVLLLLGGLPLHEPVSLGFGWALRSEAEQAAARSGWAAGEGFGDLSVFGQRPRSDGPRRA